MGIAVMAAMANKLYIWFVVTLGLRHQAKRLPRWKISTMIATQVANRHDHLATFL